MYPSEMLRTVSDRVCEGPVTTSVTSVVCYCLWFLGFD